MLIFIPRAVRADAAFWPGRRALAALDAMAWPLLWVVGVAYVPVDTGVVGRLGMALALVCAVRRVHRALWRNERYWFTTWLWGRIVVALALAAMVMKALA